MRTDSAQLEAVNTFQCMNTLHCGLEIAQLIWLSLYGFVLVLGFKFKMYTQKWRAVPWKPQVGQNWQAKLTFLLHFPFPFKAFVLGERRLGYLENNCWLCMTGLISLIWQGPRAANEVTGKDRAEAGTLRKQSLAVQPISQDSIECFSGRPQVTW